MGSFKTLYWGVDRSTAVNFEPVAELPAEELISACMVAALHEGKIVLSRPKRGWGLLGGHREAGETAEACIRREAMEEAAVELDDLRLVGRWRTEKLFDSPENSQYPPVAYQLLYTARVAKVHDFTPLLEIEERAFVPLGQMADFHHNFDDFKDVYEFLLAGEKRLISPFL